MYDRSFLSGGMWHEELPIYPVAKAGIICMGSQGELEALQAELQDACPELSFPNSALLGYYKGEVERE